MDSYDTLYRRTIELEVEARFHRAETDRLSNTIVHLASFASGGRTTPSSSEISQLQTELAAVRAELVSLHPKRVNGFPRTDPDSLPAGEVEHLEHTARQTERYERRSAWVSGSANHSSGWKRPDRTPSSLAKVNNDCADSTSRQQAARKLQVYQEDLSDLGGDESAAIPKWSSPLTPVSQPSSDNVTSPAQDYKGSSHFVHSQRLPLAKDFYPRFYEHERRKLVGFATWIEDWTEDETDAGWEEFAEVNPSHSDQEWRRFYEIVVRPELIQKGQIQGERGAGSDLPARDGSVEQASGLQGRSSERKDSGGSECKQNEELLTFAEIERRKDTTPCTVGTSLQVDEGRVRDFLSDEVQDLSSGEDLMPPMAVDADIASDQLAAETPQYPDSLVRLEHVEDVAVDIGGLTTVAAREYGAFGDCKSLCQKTFPEITRRALESSKKSGTQPSSGLSDGSSDMVEASGPSSQSEISPPATQLTLSRRDGRASVLDSDRHLHPGQVNRALTSFRGPKDSRQWPGQPNGARDRDVVMRPTIWPGENQEVRLNLHSSDVSLQHTVLISDLEPGTTLSEALGHVRGGPIVSATYIETSKRFRSMTTDAVMIVFFDAAHARAYIDFCAENITNVKAEMVKSPTFSCAFKKCCAFGSLHNATKRSRVICLYHPLSDVTPRQALSDLQNLDPCFEEPSKQPLSMKQSETGAIFLEFSSVYEAHRAIKALDGPYSTLEGFSKGFAVDPCERPLHELIHAPVDAVHTAEKEAR